MDFTGFYWVLLGLTGFYWVSLGFNGLYWVSLGFNGFYWVSLGFIGFYWVLLFFLLEIERTPGSDLRNTRSYRMMCGNLHLRTVDEDSFFFF